MSFPKIKNLIWLSENFPDLVSIKVTLEDKKKHLLDDIPGVEILDIEVDQYLDLSKLAGVRDWYPDGEDEPSPNECLVDVDGISTIVVNITKRDLLAAWIFYKTFKYSK